VEKVGVVPESQFFDIYDFISYLKAAEKYKREHEFWNETNDIVNRVLAGAPHDASEFRIAVVFLAVSACNAHFAGEIGSFKSYKRALSKIIFAPTRLINYYLAHYNEIMTQFEDNAA
jgi:hypothetical protein